MYLLPRGQPMGAAAFIRFTTCAREIDSLTQVAAYCTASGDSKRRAYFAREALFCRKERAKCLSLRRALLFASNRRRAGAGAVPSGFLGCYGFRPGGSNLTGTPQRVSFQPQKSGAAEVSVKGACTSTETCANPTRGEHGGSES